MKNNKETVANYYAKKYGFQIIALMLILFSFFSSTESKAYKFAETAQKSNLEILASVTLIKQTLASISNLKIYFVTGELKGMIQTIDKVENILLVSSMASEVQLALLTLSKSSKFAYMALLLLLGTLFGSQGVVFKKILILVLAISPGLTFYSIGMHHLSQDFTRDFGGQFESKLDSVSKNMKAEKAQLMKAHQEQLKKIAKGNKVEHFFEKLKSDVIYDVNKAVDEVEGEVKTIRTILMLGGSELMKDAVYFSSKVLIFTVFLPLGYFLSSVF